MWWLKRHPRTVRIFSDEKFFVVDPVWNAQNDRFVAESTQDVPPHLETKHPAGAMALGVVASDGKAMPLHWFPNGLKINQNVYLEVLRDVIKPWLDSNYPQGNYVWQQDSAPAHKAKKTQAWCRENLADF